MPAIAREQPRPGAERRSPSRAEAPGDGPPDAEDRRFEVIYEQHFDFVWRSLRRLGVPEASVDDAAQDVFVVVYRRLADFEGRSTVRTWLFGIALRVARSHRRRLARKGHAEPLPAELESEEGDPEDALGRRRAAEFLERFLAGLDEDKRAVFVLAELEQMTAPEIEAALGVKLNTVYSRLRAARRAFEGAVQRRRARDERLGERRGWNG